MSEVRRKVYTYRYTAMTAERMLEQARSINEVDNTISAIVFCAFSLEGYLNHVGDELVKDWSALFESLKPKEKLILISERFNVEIQLGKAPFQSFSTIFEIRNQLAHPKTKKHTYENTKKKIWLNVGERKWPAEKWETLCTLNFAEKFVADTKEIMRYLDSHLPIEKIPNFLLSENVQA